MAALDRREPDARGDRRRASSRSMIASGFSRRRMPAREIELAVQSPYLRGSELLRNRLRKRDWLLATYRKLNRLHPRSRRDRAPAQALPRRIPPRLLQHQSARHHHRHDGRLAGHAEVEPRLFRASSSATARSRSRWAATAGDELRDRAREVPRQDQVRRVRREGPHAGETNDFYLTANNNSANKQILPELWDDIVQIPEYLDGRDQPGRLLLDGPRRHDHAVPPRPDQQLHGPGDRPQASQDRPVVGHAR